MKIKMPPHLTASPQFQTQPVDPVNPFKGRYVALNFSENACSVKNGRKYRYGQDIYVHLVTDSNGYAKIFAISDKAPSFNQDYVRATVGYVSTESYDSSGILHINYPFDEYYMDEFKAPKAEALYRDSIIDPSLQTYALVKVYKGEAIVADLIINSKRVKDLINERKAR